MAEVLSLLHGSNSAIDISMATVSVRCSFARWIATITRGSTRTTTFCSAGWVEEQPGDKQLLARLDGYASKGVSYSDVLVWVTSATAIAVILTADTGCTLTFNANVFEDGIELVASNNSGRGVSMRSTGAVTSAWVVTG
jgi:hypothetical protein